MAITVITGGSRGLELECAKALKKLGHSILLVAKNEERLKAFAEELGCEYRSVDLTE